MQVGLYLYRFRYGAFKSDAIGAGFEAKANIG